MPSIMPCLWFDTQAEAAASFYTTVFPNSRLTDVSYYGEAGPRPAGEVLTVTFELDGQRFMALNGGPEFRFSEAISFVITCVTQAEVDYYWEKLADGGEVQECGWLKDRFGLSWQVVPAQLDALLRGDDPARADRVMRALLQMKKLDIAALQAAAQAQD